ncbi:MAG: ABC transporter permease [Thermoplasmata archaeon]|nr:ABC transporter permease [Thermoplasmata archaeon]
MAALTSPVVELPHRGHVFPAFALIGWRWISRNPAATIAPILLPFIFLFFLKLISPPYLFPLEIVGAMLFTTQNIGSWVLGDSAYWRIEHSLQDLFIASPLGKVRYLFGIAVSNMIAAIPAYVVLALLLASVVHVPWFAWIALAVSIGLLWVLFSAIGIAISSRLRSQREIWPVGNLLFTSLGMLSPLYLPIWLLPLLWQRVAWFLPGTYAALLVQSSVGLVPAGVSVGFESVWIDVGLLAVTAVVGTLLALSIYRWREP